MTSNRLRIPAALASIATVGACAGGGQRDAADHPRAFEPYVSIPIAAGVGEPGHGWQYFGEAEGSRAVVISPEGSYYFSQGTGLRLVADTKVD
ncbi:MAG: hypothetical protein AB1430_12005 [Pseudomonadota bacterium]